VLFLNKVWAGWGGWGGWVGGQKVVPRPSANYFVVSRRQKMQMDVCMRDLRSYPNIVIYKNDKNC
jgi:hypothetical protein